MDHRALIASLSNEERRDLTAKSDRKSWLHLAVHIAVIIVLGVLIAQTVPFWPLLLIAQGIFIVFLFTLMHECIHRTVFTSQKLNDYVAHACGFLILIPANWFRYFHFAHHRHTQDPQKDPELATPKPQTMREYIAHVSGLPVWWGSFKTLFRNALGKCEEDYVPAAGRVRVQREARWMIFGYLLLLIGSLVGGSSLLLWVWVIPIILGQPFLRLYLLAEHGLCPFVANMLENTRTTYTNRFIRRLAWNMPYHTEHHTWPTVPFHQLPHLHEIMKDELGVTADGYGAFNRDYVAGLD